MKDLDLTSAFVSKAADIARRKMEQNGPKTEVKAKKSHAKIKSESEKVKEGPPVST